MIHLLWDASDLWGPLAVRGLQGLGVPFSLARASDVAAGMLQKENPSLLFVPGGFSRRKSAALGKAGREAVRDFVRRGGAYLGFCGGAGFALSEDAALSLCPWKRAGYDNRIQHHMSGHLHVTGNRDAPLAPEKPRPLFPVWWPGRFKAHHGASVTVLAAYDTPGPDFHLADLPVSSLPPSVRAAWEEQYGFPLSFPHDEPCIITGEYGKGRYVLSHTHLETPDSPDANAYFAHLLRELASEKTASERVPAWDIRNIAPAWDDAALAAMWRDLRALFDTATAAGMFFVRSPWLTGWRMGIPGGACNTARAHLFSIIATAPSKPALAFWRERKDAVLPAFAAFAERARSYMLAERLAASRAEHPPPELTPEKLAAERAAVFGASGMASREGGLLGAVLPALDTLACLQLRGRRNIG